jgi:hypothetical protein
MDVLVLISGYFVMILGIGVIIIGIYYVWDIAFKRILTMFKIYGLFFEFICDRYRKKREIFTPQMKRKDTE